MHTKHLKTDSHIFFLYFEWQNINQMFLTSCSFYGKNKESNDNEYSDLPHSHYEEPRAVPPLSADYSQGSVTALKAVSVKTSILHHPLPPLNLLPMRVPFQGVVYETHQNDWTM